jgi:hypothetical protein
MAGDKRRRSDALLRMVRRVIDVPELLETVEQSWYPAVWCGVGIGASTSPIAIRFHVIAPPDIRDRLELPSGHFDRLRRRG